MSVIQRAKEGDKVLFSRKDISLIGIVKKVNEEHVEVEISNPDAARIMEEIPLTNVPHEQYRIVVL
ncbi:DUF2187 family protein [Pseudoneobacillus rhizosphaerae]|uniref:DUF2187 domain-containing protein n=1 Tax=Pseudoneobacillus rhizosphaerae TaxID=2880968 RepID=A0A9C7GDM4_9BACI|nr:DUF2187 family protein [Pseudoneobacillus rhizosphaerae]CAG9610403.1 hypothetical protein NEOCIP111885_04177 [Pseudoneobacillus rhizosphaerae]